MKILYVPGVPVFMFLLSIGLGGGFYKKCLTERNINFIVKDEMIQQDSLVAPGATPQLISSQFSFTEGPAVDKEGNIFFTDQPNDKIWKYGTDGKLSVFLDKTGRANGLCFDRKGNLLACADEKNEIWCVSPKKKITVLVKEFNGKQLNGPNDLWVDTNGNIYFTDPYYQRPYWTRTKPDIKEQRVYLLKAGKSKPIIVAGDLVKPNGIVGTADGKYLFVADIGDNKTYRYTIAKDGSLENKQLFAEQGSDGMVLDNRGNLYLTGNGVTIYNSSGKKILHIPIPANWTANLCFGGSERNVLFITASESIYTLAMNVKGIE